MEEESAQGLRKALLELHKALLDTEREALERTVGALSGAEFLQVVLRYPRLAWLRPLTELVTRLDSAVADPEAEGSAEVLGRSFAEARALVAPPNPETAFGSRYLQFLQEDPSVVLAHAAVAEELAPAKT